MKTPVIIEFFLAARSEKSKEKTIQRIKKTLDDEFQEIVLKIEDIQYQINIDAESWELTIFRVLQACQSLGRQWILSGDINVEFTAWSNHPIIIGVESVGVSIENPTVMATEVALCTPEI
ncbi:MAG: hypothetical protein FWG40_03390 [Peptococcaceae bacterium]|nr:hypothetical protein [Peptococcaceae bacterium]